MPLKVWTRTLAALSALALAAPAHAACSLRASPINFGDIDPLQGTATISTASIDVACDLETAYTVSLSTGAGSYAERLMESGVSRLAYNLYRDPSRTEIWGDGTGGSYLVSGSSAGTEQNHTVYGRVPHQPTAVSGAYADSIVITLEF